MGMIEHDHTFSTYTYCNFNQFTQRNLSDAYQNLPEVVTTPSPVTPFVETPVDNEPFVEEVEPKIPSLLSTAETCPRTISTQDFLIPMNLLSSRKSPDRIYGFIDWPNKDDCLSLLTGDVEKPCDINTNLAFL